MNHAYASDPGDGVLSDVEGGYEWAVVDLVVVVAEWTSGRYEMS